MKENNGFVKLHRKILQWGWFHDHNTLVVFIYLLLMANFEEHEYRGTKLKPGQLVSGRKRIAEDLGMSEQSVRTALTHLKSTNEITIKTTNKFSVITVENWEKYQSQDCESTSKTTNKLTNDQPTTNQQLTTYKNDKNDKNIDTIKDSIRGTEVPHGSIRDQVMQEWNKLSLTNVKAINEGTERYRLLQTRVKQYGLDAVLEAIRSISDSDFLLGQNKSGWTATFDWFIKPSNFAKVYDGNYLNTSPTGEKVKAMSDEEFDRIIEAHQGADEW